MLFCKFVTCSRCHSTISTFCPTKILSHCFDPIRFAAVVCAVQSFAIVLSPPKFHVHGIFDALLSKSLLLGFYRTKVDVHLFIEGYQSSSERSKFITDPGHRLRALYCRTLLPLD
ncbi:hypothetical protein CW304_26375 [Bacillus sp. UFRGS-B20]|nr:hypothetical protein CW304_26375 [Bacillus sp. UFRGS-B20]